MTRKRYLQGELCRLTLSADWQAPGNVADKATATDRRPIMSVPSPVEREHSEAVSIIDAELRRIRVARRSGSRRVASERIERLIDYVWFSAPDGGAA